MSRMVGLTYLTQSRCPCNGKLKLYGAFRVLNLHNSLGTLNMNTSMDLSKTESNMHFKIAKIENVYTRIMKTDDMLTLKRISERGLYGFVLSFIEASEENPISSCRNLYSFYCN